MIKTLRTLTLLEKPSREKKAQLLLDRKNLIEVDSDDIIESLGGQQFKVFEMHNRRSAPNTERDESGQKAPHNHQVQPSGCGRHARTSMDHHPTSNEGGGNANLRDSKSGKLIAP